jgi:hypothetical protein
MGAQKSGYRLGKKTLDFWQSVVSLIRLLDSAHEAGKALMLLSPKR